MKFCFFDTETRSRVDIGLGNDQYTRAAQCMIVTYAFSVRLNDGTWQDQPTKIWQPWNNPTVPTDLLAALADPEMWWVAHNAMFDFLIFLRSLKIRLPLDRILCTREMAYSCGLPGSLEMLGIICGLKQDELKLVDDKKLIDTFCSPLHTTGKFVEPQDLPDAWNRFCIYAIRDTESLRAIYKRLPTHNYLGRDLDVAHLNMLVNNRGFGFDSLLAQAAMDFLRLAKVDSDKVMAANSNDQVHAATQAKRLMRYLREKCNIDIDSMRASTVREWLEHDDLDPVVRVLLEQRLEAGKSSGSKYRRGLEMVGPGGRQRHTIQFGGAGRTGRFSGRGFQPHNMARPNLTVRRESGRIELTPVKASYIDDVILPGIYSRAALNNDLVFGGPHEAASLALRHVITAAEGNEMVVGDFKNIESVITAWIAGEISQITAFADAFANPKDKSKDVYRILAGAMLGKRPEDVNDTERQMGKVALLAFGFGGGVGALVTMAAGYQMDLEPLVDVILPQATSEQKAKAYKSWRRAFLMAEDYELDPKVYQARDILKQMFRSSNAKIDQMRKDIDTAVKEAVKNPNTRVFNVAKCQIWSSGKFLIIQLPSGRRLLYAEPKVELEVIKDVEGGPQWVSEYVSYSTARGKSWRRERAWSGLFVENIVQAIANDVLRAAMLRVHSATLNIPAIRAYLLTLPEEERTAISLHVHDELCLDVPKGSFSKQALEQLLCIKEAWMGDLPIAADCWQYFRYGKR